MRGHRGDVSRVVASKLALASAACALIAACGSAASTPSQVPLAAPPPERVSGPDFVAERSWAAPPDFAVFEPEPTKPLGLVPGELALGIMSNPAAPPRVETVCNEQPPQELLKRSSYVWRPSASPAEREAHKAIHGRAVEYRSRHYGYVEGTGNPAWNRLAPKDYARDGRFFGIAVRMNVRVLTALGCVEKVIAEECAETPYVPRVLDGLRTRNTFHNDEVSNHLYGIALDIDPDRNSCCGCVAPLSEWPRCKKPVSSPFERSFVPRCWVDRFERFGFYWLGYDTLEDTMHFEFLGDPARIVRGR